MELDLELELDSVTPTQDSRSGGPMVTPTTGHMKCVARVAGQNRLTVARTKKVDSTVNDRRPTPKGN
jgi:hypothetical protein